MVHARESQSHPKEKSRQLQRRLYLAAKRNGSRRFHALYDRIFRPDILWRAWQEVRANGGAAGVDGVSIEEVERQGVESFLQTLETDLKAKRYRPQPVLRVYIPKPDGRQRPLGIPTVRDRVVQQACRIVVEPLFEADFLPCSFGFRPKRSAGQAVQQIKGMLVRGWWVVDIDIQHFFDTIDQDRLLALVQHRISDRRVVKLMRQWLKAGVVEDGQWHPTMQGTPQGGVISPLLANIYLHELDRCWTHHHSSVGRLVRYADDMVVICRSQAKAETALGIIGQILENLRLTLHPTKTRLVDMGSEGFEFLGFHFHKSRSRRTGKIVPYTWPGQKAMKSVRSRIRQLTDRRDQRIPLMEVIARLNPVIRGWRNYFRIGNATKKLQDLDRYVRQRLSIAARLRQGLKGCLDRRSFDLWMRKSGIEYFYLSGICGQGP
ncbi:group II intron reverse transcriptase/maturase [Candidatus Bathyarchaeota archaeon]|jgi:group II intron reverse transcriptase/maturase|nr:group II intron reverse transcriptase/maturase [Candidatus Bathyarchaeota archaeon]